MVEGYNEPNQKPFIFFVHQITKRNDNDWKLFHLLLLAVWIPECWCHSRTDSQSVIELCYSWISILFITWKWWWERTKNQIKCWDYSVGSGTNAKGQKVDEEEILFIYWISLSFTNNESGERWRQKERPREGHYYGELTLKFYLMDQRMGMPWMKNEIVNWWE